MKINIQVYIANNKNYTTFNSFISLYYKQQVYFNFKLKNLIMVPNSTSDAHTFCVKKNIIYYRIHIKKETLPPTISVFYKFFYYNSVSLIRILKCLVFIQWSQPLSIYSVCLVNLCISTTTLSSIVLQCICERMLL